MHWICQSYVKLQCCMVKSNGSNCDSINKKWNFCVQFCPWQTPPLRFLALHPLKLILFQFFSRSNFWRVERAFSKPNHVVDGNWQRNQLQNWTFRDCFSNKWQPLNHRAIVSTNRSLHRPIVHFVNIFNDAIKIDKICGNYVVIHPKIYTFLFLKLLCSFYVLHGVREADI